MRGFDRFIYILCNLGPSLPVRHVIARNTMDSKITEQFKIYATPAEFERETPGFQCFMRDWFVNKKSGNVLQAWTNLAPPTKERWIKRAMEEFNDDDASDTEDDTVSNASSAAATSAAAAGLPPIHISEDDADYSDTSDDLYPDPS